MHLVIEEGDSGRTVSISDSRFIRNKDEQIYYFLAGLPLERVRRKVRRGRSILKTAFAPCRLRGSINGCEFGQKRPQYPPPDASPLFPQSYPA